MSPLVLIYETGVSEEGHKIAFGFNFHLAPVEVRNKILGKPTSDIDETIPKSNANWDNVVDTNPAFKAIVRQYRLDRVKNIYKVGPNGFRRLCQFKAPTYYQSNYAGVSRHYIDILRKK